MTTGSRIEMGMRILGLVKDVADPGQIADASHMPRAEIEQYLTFFTGTGLVLFDERTHLYRLSPKGPSVIAEYARLNELVNSDEPRAEAFGKLHYGTRITQLL
jgi:DNA-binding IclR family transcriptional regulator